MKNEMNEILKKSLETNPASPFLNGLVGAMDPSEREAFERFRAPRLTQKSARPHETKPNEMNIDEIPTPETDVAEMCVKHTHRMLYDEDKVVESDKMRDIERRLTIAREVLSLALHVRGTSDDNEDVRNRMEQALTQTAPKP